MTNDSIVDAATLNSIYLTAFEIAVKEGSPWALMSSYNLVNGTYANENTYLLRDTLRDKWGFDVAVITDWGGGNDPVASINNGGGLEMPSPGFDSVSEILDRFDEVDEEQLDARVAEITTLVSRVDPQGIVGDHRDLARRAAEESVVLLKNSDGVLPLAKKARVAIIGDFAFAPRYQGAGSSAVDPTDLVTAIEAIESSDIELVGAARGFRRGSKVRPGLAEEALFVARNADVVLLYIGLDEVSESEGRERLSLTLPQPQLDLIEALGQADVTVVAVISGGAPIEMPWLESCDAVVHGYLGGQEGAAAMVRVLTGEVNPSGHLAESYPLSLEDTPTARWYPSKGAYSYYKEGPFIGYRYYETVGKEVLFPFGFGLSYSSFAYDNLTVDDTGATFIITNTGSVAGADVAQLYVQGNPAVAQPAWELKAFRKEFLEAGESREVFIPWDEYTFRSNIEGEWQVFTGERQIRVAADASDEGVSATLVVDGEAVDFDRPTTPNFQSGHAQDVTDAEFALVLGRPLPQATSGALHVNSSLGDIKDARSPLARAAYRLYFKRGLEKMDQTGTPDLNLLFQYGMPFRAIAKMSGGLASMGMVHSILDIVNGHFFRGSGSLITGYFRNRKVQKNLAEKFAKESQ